MDLARLLVKIRVTMTSNPLEKQVGGKHYKEYKIQPIEYIYANDIPFIEGCIVKYATRWREKNGIEDLKKIIHYTELLIKLEERNKPVASVTASIPISSTTVSVVHCKKCNMIYNTLLNRCPFCNEERK